MKLTLIGMSGSGKTHWSKKLERKGFRRYCCDDLIEKKLDKELKHLGYKGGIKDVAKWMGQPFEIKYNETSKKYLYFEEQVLDEILNDIEKTFNEDIVIDTTGSMIYVNAQILKRLQDVTKVIYLEISEKIKKNMYNLYISDPKPVIWGKLYSKKNNETESESLKRCYSELLNFRLEKYEKLADVTLGYHKILEDHFLH